MSSPELRTNTLNPLTINATPMKNGDAKITNQARYQTLSIVLIVVAALAVVALIFAEVKWGLASAALLWVVSNPLPTLIGVALTVLVICGIAYVLLRPSKKAPVNEPLTQKEPILPPLSPEEEAELEKPLEQEYSGYMMAVTMLRDIEATGTTQANNPNYWNGINFSKTKKAELMSEPKAAIRAKIAEHQDNPEQVRRLNAILEKYPEL